MSEDRAELTEGINLPDRVKVHYFAMGLIFGVICTVILMSWAYHTPDMGGCYPGGICV